MIYCLKWVLSLTTWQPKCYGINLRLVQQMTSVCVPSFTFTMGGPGFADALEKLCYLLLHKLYLTILLVKVQTEGKAGYPFNRFKSPYFILLTVPRRYF